MLGITDGNLMHLILLIAVLPVCLWVCWSDLKTMKIPNSAVLVMVAIFAVVGFLVLPLEVWAWRWVNLPVILVIGFFLNAFAGVGAGDAKFAAAIAPFFPQQSEPVILVLAIFAACLLAAFAAHRILRAIPAVVRATPDWVSWKRKDFPMGLALVGTLLGYLTLVATAAQQVAAG